MHGALPLWSIATMRQMSEKESQSNEVDESKNDLIDALSDLSSSLPETGASQESGFGAGALEEALIRARERTPDGRSMDMDLLEAQGFL
jgi:hypothetical protein